MRLIKRYLTATAIILISLLILALVQLKSIRYHSKSVINEHFTGSTVLVIAHPDDEMMFFGPLIIHLIQNDLPLHILCLSNGSSDGLGDIRLNEMKLVAQALGPSSHLKVVEDHRLVDGGDSIWPTDIIEYHIKRYLGTASIKPPLSIVTFDEQGISGHANHISIHHAANRFMSANKSFKYYNLISVNILLKYISFLDVLSDIPRRFLMTLTSVSSDADVFSLAVNFSESAKMKEILSIHKSQMVWFRRLYMIFSRYMFLNDLTQLK